ncbi:MAG: DUF72 domain-containing protein [Chloroflexi bacterium]|nr:DUF72 domain-containing protein [Chloroflexota bacterium]
MAELYVGTCSWSDHARFYPEGLRSTEQISYYAQHFPVVEINSTYYRMPPVRNFQAWAERTPPGFVFDVKPYRQITWHDRKNPPEDAQTLTFAETLQPLRDAGKLGAVHLQFPPWFVRRPENLSYIAHVRELFPDDLVGVEFRNTSWYEEGHVASVLAALRTMDVALTVVDEPLLGSGSAPTLLEVTHPRLTIVRFHGRNYDKWYARTATTGERFDYRYSDEELAEWVPKVERLAERTGSIHLLFNNNAEDYAVQNARQLRLLLQEALPAHRVIEAPGEAREREG